MKFWLLPFLFSIMLVQTSSSTFTDFVASAEEGEMGDGEIIITNRQFTHRNKQMNYQLFIAYPNIEFKDKSVEHEANIRIQYIFNFAIADFENKLRSNSFLDSSNPNTMKLEYTVEHKSNGILSIKFFRSVYYNNDLVATNLIVTFNYDLIQNKEIRLRDLIRKEQTQSLDEQFLMTVVKSAKNCDKLSFEHLQDFCIQEENLVFFIENEFVKQNVCGPVVMVPWKKLGKVLNTDGSLKSVVK